MRRLLTASLATLAVSVAFSGEALACSCIGPEPGQEEAEFYRDAFKRSDGAAYLKVVRRKEIRPDAEPGEPTPIDGRVVLTVRVKRAYKKLQRFPRGRTFKLHTSNNDGTCGLGVRPGQRIGLLMDRRRGRWSAGLCSVISKRWLKKSSRASGSASSGSAPPCNTA